MWIEKLVKVNSITRPGTKLKGVRKIVIHYTANPGASAYNHYLYFNGTAIAQKRYASAHIFVDKTEAYLIIPLNEVAYHANDGTYRGVPELKPNANLYSIGVELCIEKDGSFHPETLRRAAEINAELCNRFKLDPHKDIVRHYDVTHKNCPARWVTHPNEFAEFKKMVAHVVKPEPVVKAETVKGSDYVGKRLTIKEDGLWFYNAPTWSVKSGTGNKGDTFIITEELKVNGVRMVKCHDGKYRTADPKHVDVTPKPLDWPYSVQMDNITHKEAQDIVKLLQARYKNAKVYGSAK